MRRKDYLFSDGTMKRSLLCGIAIFTLVLFAPQIPLAAQSSGATHPEEIKSEDVKKISVESGNIYLMKNSMKFFWVECDPENIENVTGLREIALGDVLKFKNTVMNVGVVRRITHEPTVSTIADSALGTHMRGRGSVSASISGENAVGQRIYPHSSDCLIAASTDDLPTGGKCSNLWILVEGCEVVSR